MTKANALRAMTETNALRAARRLHIAGTGIIIATGLLATVGILVGIGVIVSATDSGGTDAYGYSTGDDSGPAIVIGVALAVGSIVALLPGLLLGFAAQAVARHIEHHA